MDISKNSSLPSPFGEQACLPKQKCRQGEVEKEEFLEMPLSELKVYLDL